MAASFNLFAYGTLRRGGSNAGLLDRCEYVGSGIVHGTLYDIDGRFPALVLYGESEVRGDVWCCPASLLSRLDELEDTAGGLFRRVATDARVDGGKVPCWLYTAGPGLSRQLLPDRRVAGGEWPLQG